MSQQVTKCAECGAVLAPTNKTCPYCGAPNPDWGNAVTNANVTQAYRPVSKGFSKQQVRYLYVVAIVLVLFFWVSIWLIKEAQVRKGQAEDVWTYSYTDISDAIKGDTMYEAKVRSPQFVDFTSPAWLGKVFPLSYSPVFLGITANSDTIKWVELKFNTEVLNHEISDSITVMFDGSDTEAHKVWQQFDSREYHLSEPGKFIARLKTSHQVIVTANFRGIGIRQIEFNTSNLVWNH